MRHVSRRQVSLTPFFKMPLSVRDISKPLARSQTEARWLQSSDALLRATGQVMYECDPARGDMTFWGDVERLLGGSAAELKGGRHQWLQRVHPEDQARWAEAESARPQSAPLCQEYRFCRKDGSVVWLRDTSSLLGDEPGGRVGALQDITHQRELWMQFQHLQKKQVLGELAGGIAHDFNNLLTVFNGYTELLRDQTEPGDAWCYYLDEMASAVERAKGLTSQLLNFGHGKGTPSGPTCVGPRLTELCRLLRRMVKENIDWNACIADESGWVAAEIRQIETLCVNLVLNACAAMPQGGRLGVESAAVVIRRSDRRVKAGWKPGPYVRLTVSDTGIGMDEALKAKIFEPYFTTKPPGCGSGLGLSVCQGIVEQLGGKITVESTPGKGSSFHVFLPRIQRARLQPAANAVGKPPKGKGEQILLVEDDAASRKVLATMLRRLNYRVLCAADGGEALRIVKKEREIALVISDLVMPLMSGVELAQGLRDQQSLTAVVLISGYAYEPPELSQSHLRPIHFMTKPLSHSALAHKIREFLDV